MAKARKPRSAKPRRTSGRGKVSSAKSPWQRIVSLCEKPEYQLHLNRFHAEGYIAFDAPCLSDVEHFELIQDIGSHLPEDTAEMVREQSSNNHLSFCMNLCIELTSKSHDDKSLSHDLSEEEAYAVALAISCYLEEICGRIMCIKQFAEYFPSILASITSRLSSWPILYKTNPAEMDKEMARVSSLGVGKDLPGSPMKRKRKDDGAAIWGERVVRCIFLNYRLGRTLRAAKQKTKLDLPEWVEDCRSLSAPPRKLDVVRIGRKLLRDLHPPLDSRPEWRNNFHSVPTGDERLRGGQSTGSITNDIIDRIIKSAARRV